MSSNGNIIAKLIFTIEESSENSVSFGIERGADLSFIHEIYLTAISLAGCEVPGSTRLALLSPDEFVITKEEYEILLSQDQNKTNRQELEESTIPPPERLN